MEIKFTDDALKEYKSLKKQNEVQLVNKIKMLLKNIIECGPLKGLGKPEMLKYYNPSVYSRRISKEHRLVYRIQDNTIFVISCKGHYEK